jgi:hypothetical protein
MLALESSACAPAARSGGAEVAKGAVPAAVDTTLAKLEEPESRRQIAAVLTSAEMRDAFRGTSESLTEGVVEGLGSDAMTRNMDKLVTQLARSFVVALASSLPTLTPAIQKAVAEDLGPAMTTLLRQELAPAFAGLLDSPDVQAAVGKTTRQVAHQFVLGSNEGLAELAEKEKKNEGGQPVGTVASLFQGRVWLAPALVGAVFLVLMAWMLWQLATVRGYLQQVSGKSPRELRRELRGRGREQHA